MKLEPKINYTPPFTLRKCKRCGQEFGPDGFTRTSSVFFSLGYSDICNDCLKHYLQQNNFDWSAVDKLCQYLNLPFVPSQFEKIHQEFGEECFSRYADFFAQAEYEGLEWGDYFKEFQKLKTSGYLEDELPLIQDKHRRELQEKWGFNYDDEGLFYLETLYEGLLTTQNINGALQMDQALKLCKISYELDSRIRAGDDIDKLISSYDKLVKIAEFTPKNVKNASDFDSVGELIKWLERRGFKNSYYDDVTRDIIDETINNIQSYNRRLYTNESGIAEQINERIEALKATERMENAYNLTELDEDEIDKYDSEGYDHLFNDDDDFSAEIE